MNRFGIATDSPPRVAHLLPLAFSLAACLLSLWAATPAAADLCGATEVASIGWDGGTAVGKSNPFVRVSRDGRFVLFASYAKNLLPPEQGHLLHEKRNLFIRDRLTGLTEVVGRGVGGVAPNAEAAGGFDMDDSGRWIIYSSFASNLVADDENAAWDVFLFDRYTKSTRMISRPDWNIRAQAGNIANGSSGNDSITGSPSISPDGRFVVMGSTATNLTPEGLLDQVWGKRLYRIEPLSERVELVTPAYDGYKGTILGNQADVDSDGSVVFRSASSHLVAGVTPSFARIFITGADPNGDLDVEAPGHLDAFEVADTDLDARQGLIAFITNDERLVVARAKGSGSPGLGDPPLPGLWVIPGTGVNPLTPRLAEGYVIWSDFRVPDAPTSQPVMRQDLCWLISGCVPPPAEYIGPGGISAGISADARTVGFMWNRLQGAPYPGKQYDIVVVDDDPGSVCEPRALDPNTSSIPTSSYRPLLDVDSPTGVSQAIDEIATSYAKEPSMAAADGETRLVLFWQTPGPGTVEIRATDDEGLARAGRVGGLDEPYPVDEVVTVPVQALAKGGQAAAALYWVPESFVRADQLGEAGGDGDSQEVLEDVGLASRVVNLEFTFHPADGSAPLVMVKSLDLVRPPVVYVHGLWSGPATWQWSLLSDPRLITPPPIAYPNDLSFRPNVGRIRTEVAKTLRTLREDGIAVSQVTAVGHSMGAQLLRRHAAGSAYSTEPGIPPYERPENFGAGDIDQLISVDSAHLGSPLADVLLALIDSPLPGLSQATIGLMCRLDACPHRGAIYDSSPSSAETIEMPALHDTEAHLMVGLGGERWLEEIPIAGPLYRLVKFVTFNLVSVETLFGGPHDLLVGEVSQRNGLVGDLGISTYDYEDPERTGMHTDTNSDVRYGAFVGKLLDLPLENRSVYFLPGLPGGSPPSGGGFSLDIQGSSEPQMTIIAPATGSVYAPGANVQVVVESQSSFAGERLMVICGDTPHELGGKTTDSDGRGGEPLQWPATIECSVPDDHLGSLEIHAMAYDVNGRYGGAEGVTIEVSPGGAVTAIRAESPTVALPVGMPAEIVVLATFEDGVERELPGETQALTITSSNSEVASISGSTVTAVAPGFTELAIELAGLIAHVEVQVHDF